MELKSGLVMPSGRRKEDDRFWVCVDWGTRLITGFHYSVAGNIEEAKLFMLLVSALSILFSQYTGQNDIVIGTALAYRRGFPELENLMGYFINGLALRTHVLGNTSFLELLEQVKNTTTEAY